MSEASRAKIEPEQRPVRVWTLTTVSALLGAGAMLVASTLWLGESRSTASAAANAVTKLEASLLREMGELKDKLDEEHKGLQAVRDTAVAAHTLASDLSARFEQSVAPRLRAAEASIVRTEERFVRIEQRMADVAKATDTMSDLVRQVLESLRKLRTD